MLVSADQPILYSGPMVRALLEGRKWQTRRLLRIRGHKTFGDFGPSDTPGYDWHFRDAEMRWHDLRDSQLRERLYHKVGDRLWVREAWARVPCPHPSSCGRENTKGVAGIIGPDGVSGATWQEHWPEGSRNYGPWKPSIHMPRWASRLTLPITEVRVQRLQDIRDDDAIAEGVQFDPHEMCDHIRWSCNEIGCDGGTAVGAFRVLWNHIHGKHPSHCWAANPWVVATTFAVHHHNIDATPAGGAS